jgi:integrase
VERFRNEKRDSGDLEPGTVNSLVQRLTAILSYAVKHGYISRNPAVHTLVARVRPPRVADRVAEVVDPSEVLTAEQARALIEASKTGLHRTFITTALLTGCRSGELLALPWAHVDLAARKLKISRSLSWDRSGGKGKTKPVFGPPKTDSSYRTLDLVPELVTVLAEWKLQSRFTADTDLVFTNQTGGPLFLSFIYKGGREGVQAGRGAGDQPAWVAAYVRQPPAAPAPTRDAGRQADGTQGPEHHHQDLQPLVRRRGGQEPRGNGGPGRRHPDRW